ncbi:hypothetical protein [Kalamiella sp. sgz302252]|uniref:hypothetical protein n=1 Tax=Pantoea sp. sgz302252 TaxID=3341827 RepID=UPI0036D347E3
MSKITAADEHCSDPDQQIIKAGNKYGPVAQQKIIRKPGRYPKQAERESDYGCYSTEDHL